MADVVFSLAGTPIADIASLPAPLGTGQGYIIDVEADDGLTLQLNSIARISLATPGA